MTYHFFHFKQNNYGNQSKCANQNRAVGDIDVFLYFRFHIRFRFARRFAFLSPVPTKQFEGKLPKQIINTTASRMFIYRRYRI